MADCRDIRRAPDVETDDINNKLYLVAQGHVKIKFIKIESIILLLSTILLTACWFTRNYFYFLFVLLSIIWGMAYSIPPLRLKGKPILDLLSNALGFGFMNLIGLTFSIVLVVLTLFWMRSQKQLAVGEAAGV